MKLYNQGKQITLCKVFAYIGNNGNKKADKAAKQALDMSGITMTILPHTDY